MPVLQKIRGILARVSGGDSQNGREAKGNITMMLSAMERGDPAAADKLLPLVYDELRRLAQAMMAREAPGQTLQATALVNEAYLRLVGTGEGAWESRRHFFNAAAMAMRRALIDRARRKASEKHGGAANRTDLDAVDIPATRDFALEEMEEVGEALDALATHNARWAEIVHLRFFAGLTIEQTADALGIAPTTVKDDWTFARAWLRWKIKQRASAA